MSAFPAPFNTDHVQWAPIHGDKRSAVDAILLPGAQPSLQALIASLTISAPKITLRFNQSGIWARSTVNALHFSFFLSPLDVMSTYKYNTDQTVVERHLLTHELDQTLNIAAADTVIVIRVVEDDASFIHFNFLHNDRSDSIDVNCVKPHDARSSGAWVPSSLNNLPTLGCPQIHTSHYLSPKELLRALKQHKAPNVQITISRVGQLSLASDSGGTRRSTSLALPATIQLNQQYLQDVVFTAEYPSVLIARLLKSIETVPRSQFSVHASGDTLQLNTRLGFFSYIYYFVCTSKNSFEHPRTDNEEDNKLL